MAKHLGTIFIVGAGPGSPDLITVRGLTCLRQADVVLHDRLIDLHLLEEAKPAAEIAIKKTAFLTCIGSVLSKASPPRTSAEAASFRALF